MDGLTLFRLRDLKICGGSYGKYFCHHCMHMWSSEIHIKNKSRAAAVLPANYPR